jgi:hypothetical protein
VASSDPRLDLAVRRTGIVGGLPHTDAPLIQLGNAYRLGGGACDYTPGQPFTRVGGSICSNDTILLFTQSGGGYGKCPVGFHIIIS